MRAALPLCALLLAGCATSSEVRLSDGSKGHNIACHGTAQNYSDCLAKAGEICGERGYTVIDRDGSAAPVGVISGSPGGFFGTAGTAVRRNVFVKCK